jgi:hypothetical protein
VNIDESIRYLIDFDDAEAQTTTPEELYEAVLRKHPRRANPDRCGERPRPPRPDSTRASGGGFRSCQADHTHGLHSA